MTFYEKLDMMCAERGTNITALTKTLGFSSSAGTTWKTMTNSFPRNSTLKKIADYFGISISELKAGVIVSADKNTKGNLAGINNKDDELKVALFGGDGEITDEMWEEVKSFAAYIKQKHDKR